jgi:hypothetical protein
MKKFNKKRLTISIVLFILVIILLLFISMDIFTLSKYENTVSSQNSISTAIYLLDDSYDRINVQLPDVIPGNLQYEYSFSVSNFRGTEHSDTNIKYRVHIRTTTNMEIEYDLFDGLDIEEASSCVDPETKGTEQDYYGTYFNHLYTDYQTMLYNENKTDYYTILFTFPPSFKDAKYSGIAELIEINIESVQILSSDS